MSWVKKVPCPHVCSKPISTYADCFYNGSIWKCDSCGQQWQFIGASPLYKWVKYPPPPEPEPPKSFLSTFLDWAVR